MFQHQSDWKKHLNQIPIVPETMAAQKLMNTFMQQKKSIAVVVDEFGGTQGLVTMEDILEEIFGEINDEFDEDEVFYSRLNDYTYVFEAKISINDMCKFMEVDSNIFDDAKEDAETLGGMLLELQEEMPKKGDEIFYEDFKFVIESADKRRIKRVKVELLNPNTQA